MSSWWQFLLLSLPVSLYQYRCHGMHVTLVSNQGTSSTCSSGVCRWRLTALVVVIPLMPCIKYRTNVVAQ